MIVVIFRARLKEPVNPEYVGLAKRMEELSAQVPGFISYKTFASDDGEHASIIEFESEEAVIAWRSHPEHLAAQRQGAQFYSEYKIQVCTPMRMNEFRPQVKA